jgi:hypothetical protein
MQPSIAAFIGLSKNCLRERSERVYFCANEGEKRREPAKRANRRVAFLLVPFLWPLKEKTHAASARKKAIQLNG